MSECPHCNYVGSHHCGTVADKISANGGDPRDCSHAKLYGLRDSPNLADLVHRLRVAHAEWLPTSEHTLRAHNLLEEAANQLDRANANLRYEQHRLNYVGTHGPGCESWGPSHYECALRELARLRADVAPAKEQIEAGAKAMLEPGWYWDKLSEVERDIFRARAGDVLVAAKFAASVQPAA